MIWMSGADGLCTYFNQVWLDFTGRPMQSEVGDGWTEDVHRDDLQGCLDTYLRAFEARRRFTMEYRLRRYDGEYRWVLDTGVARFERDGRFAGYIGSCIDISERKRAEEALRTSEQSLRRSRREHRILAGRLLQAQEVERQRVARELHDDLTQRLAALAIEVGSLEQRVDRSGASRAALNGIREQLVKLSEDVHALSRQLHPAILDDLGLVDALPPSASASPSERGSRSRTGRGTSRRTSPRTSPSASTGSPRRPCGTSPSTPARASPRRARRHRR